MANAVVVEGVTADFVWYESEVLNADMRMWGARLKKLVSVMESRHKEHLEIIQNLLTENKQLKQELLELKEKINGRNPRSEGQEGSPCPA